MSNASSKPATQPASPVTWNPWLGVIYTVAVFFVVSKYIVGALISIYPFLHHWSYVQANMWLSNSVPAQFVYIFLAETLSIGAVYLFLRHYKVGMGVIGLKRPRWMDVVYALCGAVVYYALFLSAIPLLYYFDHGFNPNQQQQIGFSNVQGSWQLGLTFVSLVVLPPLAEEIMVRGLIFTSLRKALPFVQAMLITSLIFAAAHLPEGGAAGPLWVGALDTFILSLVLVFLREKTGSLASSMMLHAIKNGMAFLFLFVLHLS